jgi:MoaA/NifB/PqqE/SkfB family radical SAM enzyme
LTIKVNSFGIFGGECTEYDKCIDIVSLLSKEFPGIRLEIVTNGQNHHIISEIIKAAKRRYNLIVEFSIDGYGDTCDFLRGKQGYFSEAIQSIEEMKRAGLISNVFLNTRYYPEYEESIVEMSDFLASNYGITRDQISLQNLTIQGRNHYDTLHYMTSLRKFSRKFWINSLKGNLSRSHPLFKPYISRINTVFCVPGVQPDGYLYTCNSYNHGMQVGHISDRNVLEMLTKMLNVAKLFPNHCDNCLFGQCVQYNYTLMYENSLERI